jgi:hypothetical protein
MNISLTPQQIGVLNARLMLRCTNVEISPWGLRSRAIEVSQFQRQRLIETVKIEPSGKVKVLS